MIGNKFALWVLLGGLALARMMAPAGAAPVDESLRAFWESEGFKKSFLGAYGINSDIEPRFVNPDEQEAYAALRPLIFEEPEKAVAELTKLIKPESSALLNFTLGAIQFQLGRTDEALTQYHQAVDKFPDFRRAHRNLGVLQVREGKYEEALPSLTKTIELGGADSNTYGLLGMAYLNLEQFIAAEVAFKNALLLAPKIQEWKLGLVKSFISQEKFGEATVLLNELLLRNPDSESLWNLQATVFLQQEQTANAAVNYEILRKLGKAKPRMLMLLGDIYMTREAPGLALPVYLEAIASPDELDAGRAIRAAKILADQGAYEAGQKIIARIREVYAGGLAEAEESQLLKIESQVALATDDSARAVEVLEKIIDRNPLDGEALLMVGDYYAHQEDGREKAVFRYETAAKIEGFEADALVKHAQLLVQSGDYPQAITLLKKAQKVKPRDNIQTYLDAVERVARAATS